MSQQPEDSGASPLPPAGLGGEALAVFDLDGTLIRGDSFLPFLISYAGRRRRPWPMIVLPFYLALYACRILSDRDAKERLIGAFFREEPFERIAAHSERFCSVWIQNRLRDDSLKKLREHQAAGHRVILVSASPDLFVPQVARLLGINDIVCTRVLFENGYCSGTLTGPNCKGENKVLLLQEYLGIKAPPDHSYGYGDSRSDFPLLRWVRQGYLVRRRGINPIGPEPN
jgi:phosphatidylglycerophosphatase C